MAWKFPTEFIKKIPKVAGITGLVGAGAVALPVAAIAIRNSRRQKEDEVPDSPYMTAALPQVMEFVPTAQPQTLMGDTPVEGDFAKRYKNQRAGINAGVDSSVPNITRPDGRNAIDGSQKVDDLNAPVGRGI